MLPDQLTPRLALAIIAATIGGSLTFGYHLACLNAPVNPIKQWIRELAAAADDVADDAVEQHAFEFIGKRRQFLNEIRGADIIGVSENLLSPRCQAKRMAELEDQNVLEFSVLVSILIIGGMFGSLLCAPMADRFGRKWSLVYNIGLGILANFLMCSAKYVNIGMGGYWMFAAGRFLIGLNSGINAMLVPIYLIEIAPIDLRGSIASANQVFVTIGVLVATFVGIFFSTSKLWPCIIAFSFVPLIVSALLLPLCPESPKYKLIIERNELAAETSLRLLRPAHANINAELDAIRKEAAIIRAEPEVTYKQFLSAESLRWPLLITGVMMVAQQFSGINAVIYYSTEIFQLDAGFGQNASRWASCVVFVLYVCFTMLSTWLVDHPKFGRRLLVLLGFSGNIMSMLLLFAVLSALNCIAFPQLAGPPWNYLAIFFVILFIASFAIGPGSIPWFYVSEVFHSSARAKASSIVSTLNWGCNFLIGIGFSPLRKLIGTYIFLVFIFPLASFFMFLFLYAPETKGKTIDEVNQEMHAGRVTLKQRKTIDCGCTL